MKSSMILSRTLSAAVLRKIVKDYEVVLVKLNLDRRAIGKFRRDAARALRQVEAIRSGRVKFVRRSKP